MMAVRRSGVTVMELSFCRRGASGIRGCSGAGTARTRAAGEVHMDTLEEKEFRRHTVRLTIGGACSQVCPAIWE
ncbi:hypothetical protein GCM10009646_87700 [Streptomyces aureus]